MVLKVGYSLRNISDISSLDSFIVLLVWLYAFNHQVLFLLLLNHAENCKDMLLDNNGS